MIKTCHQCGKPFEARNRRAKYCDGPCYRAKEAAYSKRARASWSPERRRAGATVQTAIYNGSLIRRPCEVCGTKRQIDAHHDDYSKPLEVRWLCRHHHRLHHERESRKERRGSC
jgi:hypothetical protein